MRKLNRKLLLLLLTAFLLANATVVYAYTMQHTQDLVNTFLPARVDSEVVETFENDSKSVIKIQNTSNVEAYLRMKIITYWQDSKGNIVAIPPETLTPSIDGANWFLHDNGYYYYKHPVPAGVTTSHNLLTAPITMTVYSEVVNGVTYTYYPVVEIVSEAFQSRPAHAVQTNWGVAVDITGDISKKETT